MMWLAISSPTWLGRRCARFDRRPHAADVAADDRGHQAAADLTRFSIFTLAALAIASVASTSGTRPLVSIKSNCLLHGEFTLVEV